MYATFVTVSSNDQMIHIHLSLAFYIKTLVWLKIRFTTLFTNAFLTFTLPSTFFGLFNFFIDWTTNVSL